MRRKAGNSYLQRVSLRAPINSPWDPMVAQQCAVGLYAIDQPFALQIRARQDSIAWSVDVPSSYVPMLENHFYSLYSSAAVIYEPEVQPDIDYFVYELQGAVPFVGPLSYALDFRELDPLVGVLTVMTALESDEACVMSLALSPPTKNYPRMGAKLITESRNAWWQFITPSMAVEAFMWQSMIGIERRVPKYEADIQREAAQKLRMPLKESRLLFKIQARSQQRADDLFMQFASPVAIYGRDGLNELVPAHKDSYQLILAPLEVAALWHLPNEACNVPGITWTTDKNVPPPIELLQSTQGVLLGQTFYRGRSLDAHIANPDRGTHISVGGRTRTGKSTFVHNMVHQDIQAGKAVGVIDPHGNLVQDILQNSIPPHREDDVVLFDWDENEKVIGLNPLYVPDGVDPSTAAAVALSFMRKFFGDSWIDGRMEDTFYACIVSLMSVKGSVVPDISRILLDDVFRRQVLQHVTDFAALNYWHLEFNPASAKVKQELARPVNTRIRKLYRDKALRRIVGQPECLNFADIISGKKIFLANLRGASKLEGNSIGALLITQIQMTTMGRARQASTDRTPFYLYIDEVQNFIVTSLPEMLSEAGKYGLNLTTANQYMGQLDADTAKSMLGNIGTNIIFRSGRDDAALYAPLIEPAYTADDVVNLSRFKAFVKTQYQGNTLPAFLINTSPPPQPVQSGSGVIERIVAKSRAKYGRPVAEIDANLAARYRRDVAAQDEPPDNAADVSGEQFYG